MNETMRKNFSYDEDGDSLIVSNKIGDEKVYENIEAGDIILSFTKKGKLVSVEIREVSPFLEARKINPDLLNSERDIVNIIIPKIKNIFFN